MSPLFAASLLVLVAAGCSKPSNSTRMSGDGNAASQTEIRGAVLVAADAGPPGEANAYVAAVRREQLQLREKLLETIATVDRQGGAATDRRQQLRDHLVEVDRSDERGWDELKAEVEHDLATASNH